MATKAVTQAEYEQAKGIALRCAKNIVEDFSGRGGPSGTDIDDALKSGAVLTHQLAIIRRWWAEDNRRVD